MEEDRFVRTANVLFIFALLVVVMGEGELWRDEDSEDKAENSIKSLLELGKAEKFLWYSSHSGFGNQLVAFRNALRIAGILNRTLIIPPILSHYDLSYGDCASGKVSSPNKMRSQMWNVQMAKLESSNYMSMADAIDLTSIPSGLIQTIDFRVFAAMYCGMNVTKSLSSCSWCKELLSQLSKSQHGFAATELERRSTCSKMLGVGLNSSFSEISGRTVYLTKEDCRASLIFYSRDPETGELESHWSLEERATSSCRQGIPTYSNRLAVNRTLGNRKKHGLDPPQPVNIMKLYGDSLAARADVLSLGSAFYFFDFSIPMGDSRADEISCVTEFLSFPEAMMKAARSYSELNLSSSYACLHFRGADAFYVDLQEQTLREAKQDLRVLRSTLKVSEGEKITLFLMSDLTNEMWQRKYMESFEPLGFRITFPFKLKKLYRRLKEKTLLDGRGILTNRIPKEEQERVISVLGDKRKAAVVQSNYFKNVGVLLEQAVCSCASVGFVGNHISSVSRSVHHLRNGGACSRV